MYVDDLDIPAGKISDTIRRIIDRAIDESRRREHALTSEHLFLAFAQVKWTFFAEAMRDVELNPHTILRAIEGHLRALPPGGGGELRVTPPAKLVCKRALHHANRTGRQVMDPADLFIAMLQETSGVPVSIVRQYGVDPEVLVLKVDGRTRDLELRVEHLKKRFELPPYLRQYATNLNMLAQQDRLPPVFGRDQEIQQVLEVLCHRERANSVMLLGEPGVGKTVVFENQIQRLTAANGIGCRRIAVKPRRCRVRETRAPQ
jgi:ATP-dependent Clp protease ATP-binding subunit ClpA